MQLHKKQTENISSNKQPCREYDYFKENQAFPIKGTKKIVLKERKNNEIALQVGFDFSSISLNQYFANNELAV